MGGHGYFSLSRLIARDARCEPQNWISERCSVFSGFPTFHESSFVPCPFLVGRSSVNDEEHDGLREESGVRFVDRFVLQPRWRQSAVEIIRREKGEQGLDLLDRRGEKNVP